MHCTTTRIRAMMMKKKYSNSTFSYLIIDPLLSMGRQFRYFGIINYFLTLPMSLIKCTESTNVCCNCLVIERYISSYYLHTKRTSFPLFCHHHHYHCCCCCHRHHCQARLQSNILYFNLVT